MNKKIIKIALCSLAVVSLSACSESNNSSQGGSKVTSSSKKAEKPKIKYYKKGETVKVGKVEYTIKSAVVTSERNEFENSKPKNVIKVTYHVKNDGKKDLSIGGDIDAYGPDNTKLKSYPVSDTTLDAIAPGKEADVIEGFGSKKLGNFEFQLRPFGDFESKSAKFKVNIK